MFYAGHTDDHFLRYIHVWSTQQGVWDVDIQLSVATEYHLSLSYDRTSINNDPKIYIDGVPQTVVEILAPIGTVVDDSGWDFHIGSAGVSLDGKSSDTHIANVIWTPEELASLHASNAPGYWMRGLIFYAQMNGAAGLQEFDGASFGAANKVIDQINGILGTPTGNPLGVADTILAV